MCVCVLIQETLAENEHEEENKNCAELLWRARLSKQKPRELNDDLVIIITMSQSTHDDVIYINIL